MGDWNATIGDKAVEGISGTHGLGDRRVIILYWLLGLNLFQAYQIAEDYLLSLGFMF